MRPTTVIAAFAAFAIPALGELAVTSPVAGSTCSGGQSCSIAWNDNNQGVTLAQQANCTVALYTGSKTQQTFLQPIAFPDSINVATTSSLQFTVDPTVGESGDYYFIRFTSLSLKNGANPYLSFSAVFTLDGMTGTFNQTVKNEIQGLTSSSSAPTAPATSKPATTNTRSSTSASRSASASASLSNKNGTGAAFVKASPVTYTGVAAFIGAAVGLFL